MSPIKRASMISGLVSKGNTLVLGIRESGFDVPAYYWEFSGKAKCSISGETGILGVWGILQSTLAGGGRHKFCAKLDLGVYFELGEKWIHPGPSKLTVHATQQKLLRSCLSISADSMTDLNQRRHTPSKTREKKWLCKVSEMGRDRPTKF